MWKIREDEFKVSFMEEHGYKRNRCKKCGAYFWSIDEKDLCGESPCVEYTFLDKPPTKGKYNLHEIRNKFLKFFEKNGHEIINPYPVVARWRDDLLITIASIADFQPYVTSGVSEPPANPLVISQPCLRFEDINKVGITLGRHLTIFEMGGAHAFNDIKKNKMLYWKSETIEFHNKFAIEELGIPEEMISFKEHFWVGGGNAGPDVEGIISGLEVSTLVFMMYKILPDGSLKETPIWTVDTGYGMERWTWLSTGYPTAFEAIYEGLYRWILNIGDISIPKKILKDLTIGISMLKEYRSHDIDKVIMDVSYLNDYDFNTLKESFNKFVDFMKILDFSKSVLFLIKDGGIPSNVREGYLTRMLLRRVFRIIEKHDLDYNFIEELFKRQFKYWIMDFKELKDIEDNLFDIIKYEYNKYLDVLKKVPNVVRWYIKRLGGINLDSLIEIYDSYGIPPEYVRDEYKRLGGNIKIPENFTELVSQKHLEKGKKVGRKVENKYPSEFSTKELYYENPYWKNGVAKVLYVGDDYIILDQTIFYPGEGGQECDTGYIISPDGTKYKVDTVFKYGKAIVHHVANKEIRLKPGEYVRLEIDWDRRYSLMRHHTSTHILLSAIRKVLGKHIWQAGAEKTPEYARLDVTHYKLPTTKEISKIEFEANKIISERRNVYINLMERGMAEKRYGPIIYQGGVVPGKYIRIVEIDGWDVEACGGTHVRNTSELMYIKIINVEKIHDGVIRFIYVAGEKAVENMWKYYEAVENIKILLSTSLDSLQENVSKILNENLILKKKISRLEDMISYYKAKELFDKRISIKDLNVVIYNSNDINELIKLGEELDKISDSYLYIGYTKSGRGYNVIVRLGDKYIRKGFSAKNLSNSIRSLLKKSGGRGNDKYARIGGVGELYDEVILKVVGKYVEEEK